MKKFSYPGISIKKISLLPSGLTIHYKTGKILNILELDVTNTCEQLFDEGYILGYSIENEEPKIKSLKSKFSPLAKFVVSFKITTSTAHKIVKKFYQKKHSTFIYSN